MSAPAVPPVAPPTPPRPLVGREWLIARATLAARRTARFTKIWSAALGALAVVALLLPLASSDPRAGERARIERLVADTLLTSQRVRRAQFAVAQAESLLVVARLAPATRTTVPARTTAAPPRPAATVARAPMVASLDAAIQEARRLRTVPSWLAVAEQPAVSEGPRMRAVADTLARLARERDEIPGGPSRDQLVANLTPRIGRLGYTILAIAENRLRELAPESTSEPLSPRLSPSAPEGPVTVVEARADTQPLLAALVAARDTLARAARAHDSLGRVIQDAAGALAGTAPSRLASISPALLVVLVLAIGLLVRFGTALRAEMRAPTLAHAQEAERVAGASVVAVVREALLDGPARYRPSGVDPFRMLYLGLTATGTRARTAIITGSDPVIIAAVGGRLAIAAAADHRTTLLIDLDPREIALSRTFRERAEPGLTDALAGAFKWREVARPVGSSDGLPITLLPAGTERDDLPIGEALDRAREEFTRFRIPFELTILVASPTRLGDAVALVEKTPVVHCATAGSTEVEEFMAESGKLRADGYRVHGVVLWEALRPVLPTRAELAALLTKRKGRTPGGSFEAVKKAVSKPVKNQ
ncbi:MAG: hypothetical protein OEW77_10275 [Gemmatimonadota bacterium]|nr:hypothetical protein [Gemmatimonadota bacterium]